MRLAFFMTMMLAWSALLGCGELVADTGHACVVPQGTSCTSVSGYSSSMGLNEVLEMDCGVGSLAADEPLAIDVVFGYRPDEYADDAACEVEITGDHELTITASVRWHVERSEWGVHPEPVARCHTPPLEAGTWTLRYGESGVATVPIPTADAPIFCMDSGRDP